VIDRVHEHPEAGLRVVGVLGNDGQVPRVGGVPVLGRYEQVRKVLALCGASQVVLALPHEDQAQLEALLNELDDELVDLRLVPDLLHIATLRSSVEDFDGLPVISLRDSPLVGWAAIQKRVFDIVASALGLLLVSPFLAALALAVRFTCGARSSTCRSAWPRRPRLPHGQIPNHGDGRREQWPRLGPHRRSARDADRRLLATDRLDELPQLWNVLRVT